MTLVYSQKSQTLPTQMTWGQWHSNQPTSNTWSQPLLTPSSLPALAPRSSPCTPMTVSPPKKTLPSSSMVMTPPSCGSSKGGTSQGKDHSKQHSHNTLWRERPHPQHRQDKRNNNGLQKETCPSVTSYHHRDGGGKGRQPQIPGTPGDIWPELDTTATVKRAQQRLYFIRKLRKAWAYMGLVESTLTTDLIVWYGNTTEAER